jgi:hypothetical protein
MVDKLIRTTEPGLIMVGIGWPPPPPGEFDPTFWREIEYFTPESESSATPAASLPQDQWARANAQRMTRLASVGYLRGRPGQARSCNPGRSGAAGQPRGTDASTPSQFQIGRV